MILRSDGASTLIGEPLFGLKVEVNSEEDISKRRRDSSKKAQQD